MPGAATAPGPPLGARFPRRCVAWASLAKDSGLSRLRRPRRTRPVGLSCSLVTPTAALRSESGGRHGGRGGGRRGGGGGATGRGRHGGRGRGARRMGRIPAAPRAAASDGPGRVGVPTSVRPGRPGLRRSGLPRTRHGPRPRHGPRTRHGPRPASASASLAGQSHVNARPSITTQDPRPRRAPRPLPDRPWALDSLADVWPGRH